MGKDTALCLERHNWVSLHFSEEAKVREQNIISASIYFTSVRRMLELIVIEEIVDVIKMNMFKQNEFYIYIFFLSNRFLCC